ncbi:MAG: DUF1298 domain-containing protein, partial [Pseudomonadales bacterium]|nr:DUF1298 domain-containing protein [Pseudomonadales bacterium]
VSGGDWQDLCQCLSDHHAEPLPSEHAQWQAVIIDGITGDDYPEGSFVFMLKVHHAIMDGRTGMAIFSGLHQLEAKTLSANNLHFKVSNKAIQTQAHYPNRLKQNMMTLPAALKNNSTRYMRLLHGVPDFSQRLYRYRRQARHQRCAWQTGASQKTAILKPVTRFNREIRPQRVFGRIKIPLSRIQEVRQHVKRATINDVALALVSGAMRLYLQDKGELPATTLSAAVPMDARRKDDISEIGNQVSLFICLLSTDIENPIERLRLISQHSRYAKQQSRGLGRQLLPNVLEAINGGLLQQLIHYGWQWQLFDKMPAVIHTVVTHVSGVTSDLYLDRARLLDSFGMGPLLPTMGLFHTVTSTQGDLSISFTSCPSIMPDPEFYQRCFEESLRSYR